MKRREIARRHLDGALRGVKSDEGVVDTALEIDGPQSRIILRFRGQSRLKWSKGSMASPARRLDGSM